MLAAGDTFRAAAVEQLQSWGQREDIPVIAQPQGSDSASVAFDAVQSAQAKGGGRTAGGYSGPTTGQKPAYG